ncbi:MAG: hypothetical protein IGS03_18490 [Candidatus Sericytochromatia bacterium]|nr:hypothetical protein [Candidatus Sericytochromatia bacterium]
MAPPAQPVNSESAVPQPPVPAAEHSEDSCQTAACEASEAEACLKFTGKADKVFYINGIMTSEKAAREAQQSLSETIDQDIELIYNPSQNLLLDGAEALANLSGIDTRIAREIRARIRQELGQGQTLQIYAHSQGAAIVADALRDLGDEYRHEGLKPDQIKARMAQVEVVSFGGFATEDCFPEGVRTNLIYRGSDSVPQFARAFRQLEQATQSKERDFLPSLWNATKVVTGNTLLNAAQTAGHAVGRLYTAVRDKEYHGMKFEEGLQAYQAHRKISSFRSGI